MSARMSVSFTAPVGMTHEQAFQRAAADLDAPIHLDAIHKATETDVVWSFTGTKPIPLIQIDDETPIGVAHAPRLLQLLRGGA